MGGQLGQTHPGNDFDYRNRQAGHWAIRPGHQTTRVARLGGQDARHQEGSRQELPQPREGHGQAVQELSPRRGQALTAAPQSKFKEGGWQFTPGCDLHVQCHRAYVLFESGRLFPRQATRHRGERIVVQYPSHGLALSGEGVVMRDLTRSSVGCRRASACCEVIWE